MKRYLIAILSFALLTSCVHKVEQVQTERVVNVDIQRAAVNEGVIMNSYSGVVEESHSVDLKFRYGGTCSKVMVRQGDYVHCGDTIAMLVNDNAKSSLKAAQATLNQAEDGYKRLKKVYQSGSLPEVKWVEVQTNLAKARSTYDVAKSMLDETILVAPFDGVLVSRNIEEGEAVSPMEPVGRLINTESLSVSIAVSENEIVNVAIGDSAVVEIPALSEMSFKGHVIEKGLKTSIVSHTYPVKVQLDENDARLMPGMVARVTMVSDRRDGIIVPIRCVLINQDEHFVWLVEDGRAQRRAVSIDGLCSDGVLVKDGLNEGDPVIIGGYQKVSTGMRVE